ncbi:MAG TPA: two-component regulator propeller domain-containing protein, partial [Bacteroidota bacterium]
SGLVYFTDADTGNGEVNATGKTITFSDGLTSSTVTNIAVDRDGDLWVGADQGITVIVEPQSPRSPGAIALFHPLREQYINTIAVDALNNKWVGTKEGVFYLSPDGTQIIAQLTVNNTEGKLIDNDVKSIAIDGSSGVVYFGTEHGLASLRTVAVEPSPSFLELSIAPNPYIIPSAGNLSIDGLVAEASIKILSVDGSVVREFRSPGGRVAFWDGKNADGQYVSTGVYFVVAASADGNDLTTAKVAVVRHN